MTDDAFFFLKARLEEPTRPAGAWKFDALIVACSLNCSAFWAGSLTAYCYDVSLPTKSSCSCTK